MRNTRVLRTLVAALVFFGTAALSATAASAATKGGPKRGGTLTSLYTLPPNGLAPWSNNVGVAYNFNSNELYSLYDALVSVTPKATPIYRIAQSMTPSDGATVWTMKLRPGVKFTDGTPFDAAAVQFNWNFFGDPANALITKSSAVNVAPIASTKVINALTLQITLKAPNGLFPLYLAERSITFVGSPTAIQSEGPMAFASNPVGAGAFTLGSFTPGSQLTLVRNPHFYMHGLPYLNKLVFQYPSADAQRFDTLLTGGADLDYSNDVTYGPKADAAGFTEAVDSQGGGIALDFNSGEAPFNNPEARQAVEYALDLNQLNASVFSGDAAPVTTIYPKGSLYYDAKAKQLTPNQAKAQALFNQLAAQGDPVNFTLLSSTIPPYSLVGQWVQATLASYQNVKVTLNELATPALLALFLPKNYQANGTAIALDPNTLDSGFSSSGATNYYNYSNPTTDAALQAGLNATSEKARIKDDAMAQEQIAKDIPVIFLVRLDEIEFYKKSVVGGFSFLGNGGVDWTTIYRK